VHAEQAARVLAGRARLAPEAGAERREGERQFRAVENFLAKQVRDRNLRGRNREERVVAQRVHVFLELRQLAGAGHRVAIDEERHLRLLVAELARVQVDAEVHQRTLQPRAAPAIHDEARARDLRAARQVEQPERLRDLPVRLHAARGPRLTPRAHDDVGRRIALGHLGKRDVGELVQDRVELALGCRKFGLEPRDLAAECACARDEIVGVLARLLPARDFLTCCVSRGLALLDGLDGEPAVAVEPLRALDEGTVLVERTPPPDALAQRACLLADHPAVDHGSITVRRTGSPESAGEIRSRRRSSRARICRDRCDRRNR